MPRPDWYCDDVLSEKLDGEKVWETRTYSLFAIPNRLADGLGIKIKDFQNQGQCFFKTKTGTQLSACFYVASSSTDPTRNQSQPEAEYRKAAAASRLNQGALQYQG